MTTTDTLHQIVLGAIARGWCHPDNSQKEVDATLAIAMADEVVAALSTHTAQAAEPLPYAAAKKISAAIMSLKSAQLRMQGESPLPADEPVAHALAALEAIYTLPPQPATHTAQPLTDERIEAGFRAHSWSEVPHPFRGSVGFERGVRFAERAHGIGTPAQQATLTHEQAEAMVAAERERWLIAARAASDALTQLKRHEYAAATVELERAVLDLRLLAGPNVRGNRGPTA